MRLSIILPTYNMEKYLARCIESLLDQDIPEEDYEIIIVNDESKDSTLQIAKDFESKHSQVVVCDKKNGGAGAARNSGLEMAKGKYIHFVDPDDYIAKNVYGTLLDFADAGNLDILGFVFTKTTRTDWLDSDTEKTNLDLDSVPIVTGTDYIANNNYRNTVWWYLINRSFLESTELKFIEGRWMEDSILTPQLFMKANRMARLDYDVYRYMITPNSAMTSKEPNHYNKLISDIENATFVFDNIIKKIPETDSTSRKCKNRVKTRQQSFVFFLLVRLMKSRLPIKYIPQKLEGFKKIGAYPLNNFIGEDFNGFSYGILTKIFNKEKTMYLFMKVFRVFYYPLSKLTR